MNFAGLFHSKPGRDCGRPDVEKAQDNSMNREDTIHVEDDDPLAPTSRRRLRRLTSATESTFFSNPVNRHAMNMSEMSNTSWRAKWKAYIFPSDESAANAEDFVPNYRWLPIVSGILIPFSILLEIPGLTERWYIKTQSNQVVDTKPNPTILDVGMAFSLGCAVIANICLVCRFLEKRVKTTTLLCILFLTTHGR